MTLLMFCLAGYGYDYEYDKDAGVWFVDNFHGCPNHVLLYYMVKPDRQNQNTRSAYGFAGKNVPVDPDYDKYYLEYLDEVKEIYGYYTLGFAFAYQSENRKVIDTITSPDGTEYEIWLWQFGIEDGEYSFSGMDDYHDYTLDTALNYTGKEDWIDVSGGDTIKVYTFFEGSYHFPEEDKKMLIKYAKQNEFGYVEEETIAVEQTEPVPVHVIEESEDPEEEIKLETIEPETENKSLDMGLMIKSIAFILISAGCIIWANKIRKERQ